MLSRLGTLRSWFSSGTTRDFSTSSAAAPPHGTVTVMSWTSKRGKKRTLSCETAQSPATTRMTISTLGATGCRATWPMMVCSSCIFEIPDSHFRTNEGGKKIHPRSAGPSAERGARTPEAINPNPLSLSPVKLALPGYAPPREATTAELEKIVSQFARAAGLAKDAGFSGVEVHAAHGYLLSSALSPRINLRDDEWGGTLEKRARLPLKVVRAVRAGTGDEFVVGVKLNTSDFQKGGLTAADSIATARMLQEAGADFVEVSGGNFEQLDAYQHNPDAGRHPEREAYFLRHAGGVKSALDIPVMATGGFRSRTAMTRALETSGADIIGMGRPFIVAPDFAAKLLSGGIASAPALERTFPPADELPRGAVLNWFCHQLLLRGQTGEADLTLPVLEGHEKYMSFAAAAPATRIKIPR